MGLGADGANQTFLLDFKTHNKDAVTNELKLKIHENKEGTKLGKVEGPG